MKAALIEIVGGAPHVETLGTHRPPATTRS
jgi:hypothetical protein